MRRQNPQAARLVDEFYFMLSNPQAPKFKRKDSDWWQAMEQLSGTYQRFMAHVQFDQRELLKAFFKAR